jgi:hypothetical protein
MDNIHVHDNFLCKEDLKIALSIIKEKKWSWGHMSKGTDPIETPFWNTDLIFDDFFSVHLKELIEKYFLKNFKLIRVYANGQTFGQDGVYHKDSEEDNTYTFVLYLSNISKDYIETAGGHIFFKFPDKDFKICYEPIMNRGILFPSNYLHKSTSFCRYVMDMRICVAFKLIEIKSSTF